MNRTELELRIESLKKQQELTSKAIEDTQRQLDDLDAEENLKVAKKVLEPFLKFKGKIIVWQAATWKSYIFKCKDIVPCKSKYQVTELTFVAEGNIYCYNGMCGKECLEMKGTFILVSVGSKTLEQFKELKDWGFWLKRPTIKLINIAKGVEELIKESGLDTNIDYDDKPVKQNK